MAPAPSEKERQEALNREKWLWFVTGPTACGKTTVAKYLADKLSLVYLEGDDFHSKADVEKMSRGEPLTDSDRQGWLAALRDEAEHPRGGRQHLIITCSALKRHYRDVLREASEGVDNILLRFIFLIAPEEVLRERARARKGHYAGANIVGSQFEILELPQSDEKDIITVDVDRPMEEVEKDVLERLQKLVRAQK